MVDAMTGGRQLVVRRHATALGEPSGSPLAPDGPDPGVLPPVDEVRFQIFFLAQPSHHIIELVSCPSRK